MNTLTWISLLLLTLYVIKILKYRHDWIRYPTFKPSGAGLGTGISVIVAFRNEQDNLPALLSALQKQQYPASLFEVILVNDHSDDGSAILVQDFCREHANFRLVQNEITASGKKSAIINGIAHASFELILTTDADCTMTPFWLATLAEYYQDRQPAMIIGLVQMNTEGGFLGGFQETEFLSLVAAGAGAAAGYDPVYCNGACLAFRKSLFLSYADPTQVALVSGDDTLFMLTVKRSRRGSIILLKSIPAMVNTRGMTSWRDFFHQRKRWVSKSLYYRDRQILYTAVLVFLVNVTVISSLTAFFVIGNYWLFPVVYTVKMLTDLMFLKSYMEFLGKELPVLRFMLYELMYPFYAVFISVTGLSTGFTWKGRRFRINSPIPT
jgi:poly-beta-1,6-N-acetyl-D-glucosamine synthase